MKVLIISEYNIFTTIGGTEYYVDMLIKGLLEKRVEVVLVTKGTQRNESATKLHEHKSFKYKTIFLAARNFTRKEITQQIVSSTWDEMLPVMLQERPDVVHVHTYTTFFNIRHFEKCKEHFNKIFFTSHVPGNFCPKGDLIKYNKKPCDGIIYFRCSVCLFSKGIKEGVSNLLFQYYRKVLSRLQILNNLGVKLICVSEWQKQQVISNGFTEGHISIVRQAISVANYSSPYQENINEEFTIGYLGRLSPEKGSLFLLKIISKLIVSSRFRFVLGIPIENSNPDDVSLLRTLCEEAGERITVMENIDASNKELFFNEIDCLLVPSFCIETGPIVLLEALVFNKQAVVPDVGGPLELKSAFSENVTIYHWNNLQSVVESLLAVSKKPRIQMNTFRLIEERENLFINRHEEIYSEVVF